MPRQSVLIVLALLCLQVAALGQQTRREETAAAAQPHVAEAIQTWADDFSRGRLGARGLLRRGFGLQPGYMTHARKTKLLRKEDYERLTHLDVLQKLMFFAESNPSPAVGEAVLSIAAIGLEGSFLDRTAFEIRELGHWTLARMKNQGIWFQLLRAAAGERVPVFDELRKKETADEAVSIGPARRVAALRLLGQRGLPVFRSTLEAALVDTDPRVRLAAAESIRRPWREPTIRRVGLALQRERHPVVSQALVRLLFKMLKYPPKTMTPATRESIVRAASTQLGKAGWRTDMDLLDLVGAYPQKSAIRA